MSDKRSIAGGMLPTHTREIGMRARHRHRSPIDPLLTAMGGTGAAARKMGVKPRTVGTWRHRGLSLNAARLLRGWGQHLGDQDAALAYLAGYIAAKERRKRALAYIAKCIALHSGEWWPQFRGRYSRMQMPREPEHPPQDMSDDEVAVANRWLASKGWIVLRGAGGLRVTRML